MKLRSLENLDSDFTRSLVRVSRDLWHAFHAILGSDFPGEGWLADGFMGSGLIGLVKCFWDGTTPAPLRHLSPR